jgi:hypothetical protein
MPLPEHGSGSNIPSSIDPSTEYTKRKMSSSKTDLQPHRGGGFLRCQERRPAYISPSVLPETDRTTGASPFTVN